MPPRAIPPVLGPPPLSNGQAIVINTAAKLAIPRLKTDPNLSRGTSNRRVTRACQLCREKKIKCSGDQPTCTYCQTQETTCHYIDGRRDQAKKQLNRMSARVKDYEKLLQDMSMRVSEEDSRSIQAVIEKHTRSFSNSPAGRSTPTVAKGDVLTEIHEISDSSSVGSLSAIDRADEDFDRSEDTRTTGFLGKSSEITWMQKLEVEVGRQGRPHKVFESCIVKMPNVQVDPQQDQSIYSMSYHLDDLKIQDKGVVDPFELPDSGSANKLLDAYLASVHPSFPILEKRSLISQHGLVFNSSERFEPGKKFLAILNMVFAIAAKYSHLTLASWAGDKRDHLVYFTRARMLSMDGTTLFSHPDMQQIQVEGLISFYLIATGQINRAWRISSIPLRSAIALGLNLQNTAPDTDASVKEIRYRVWWSLLIIERLLGNMTGRPTCAVEGISTVPLPVPFEEENFQDPEVAELLNNTSLRRKYLRTTEARASTPQSSRQSSDPLSPQPLQPQGPDMWLHGIEPNDSLYFLYSTDLTLIAQDILNTLYTTKSAQTPWPEIIQTIVDLRRKTDSWFSNLPNFYNFTIQEPVQTHRKEKLRLALLFYSSKILLTRPCLCRLSRREAQNRKSRDDSFAIAAECVESACLMLDQLPDEPDAISLNQSSPWWCLIHYLMQATTVLLLELSFHSKHVPHKASTVENSAKKAILWLHDMAKYSATSERAWALCDNFARRLAPHIGFHVESLPKILTPHIGRPASPHSPTMSIDNQQPYVQQPARNSSGQPFHGDLHFTSSNGYDEYLPFDPITGEITSSLFPTGVDPNFFDTTRGYA